MSSGLVKMSQRQLQYELVIYKSIDEIQIVKP